MNHSYIIEHKGLLLRPLAREDIEQLRIWRNDAGNSRFIRKLPFITQSAQEVWFEGYLRDETLTFAIEFEGSLVGSVALYDISESQAEFGRLMIGESKGRGFGRLATEAILRVAFDQLGLEQVIATVSVGNVPALKIYTLVGFQITGMEYSQAAHMDEYTIKVTPGRFKSLQGSFEDGIGNNENCG